MNRYAKEFYSYVEQTEEYKCLGDYKNSRTKISMEHSLCGYVWDIIPNSFKSKGTRCPKCHGNAKKTNDEFLKEINNNKELVDYIPLEEYKSNRTPILILHKTCNNSYKVTPYKLLEDNNRCPYCSGRKGHDYHKECSDILGEGYVIESNPKKHVDNVIVKHLKCGNEYTAQCNKILQGRKCPYCKSSKMEEQVRSILNEHKVTFKEQYRINDCRNKLPLPFDFALELNNELVLIECQGRQHYENVEVFDSLEGIQIRDEIKHNYCKTKGIKLLTIPFWEVDIKKHILTKINI